MLWILAVEVLDFIDGYIFLAEETPDYIARGLVSRVKQYAETLKTPFFGALSPARCATTRRHGPDTGSN